MTAETTGVPATMQAIEIREPGDPEVLQPCTRQTPIPAADEVLVRVAAEIGRAHV